MPLSVERTTSRTDASVRLGSSASAFWAAEAARSRRSGELSPNDFLALSSGLSRSMGALPLNGIASLDYHDRRLDVGFKPEVKVDPDFPQRLARNGLAGEVDSSTGKWTIRSRP